MTSPRPPSTADRPLEPDDERRLVRLLARGETESDPALVERLAHEPALSARLRELRATWSAVGGLAETTARSAEIGDGAADRILERVRTEPTVRPTMRWAAAAALLAGIALGFVGGRALTVAAIPEPPARIAEGGEGAASWLDSARGDRAWEDSWGDSWDSSFEESSWAEAYWLAERDDLDGDLFDGDPAIDRILGSGPQDSELHDTPRRPER